jgi:eukaryotic-like serine/threonine-protein kinase
MAGGSGDVVLARHDASGTLVAIKYLRRGLLDDPEFAEMFRAEAGVLATMQGPGRRPAPAMHDTPDPRRRVW